jgi:hypothetical protein
MKKLIEKNQSEKQRKQAHHAVMLVLFATDKAAQKHLKKEHYLLYHQ